MIALGRLWLAGSKKQAAFQAAGPAESESAGKIAQCHILFDFGDHSAQIVGQPILAAAGFQPATAAPKTRAPREIAA
jgi:hypothetical protein